jgi:hypothetical protein
MGHRVHIGTNIVVHFTPSDLSVLVVKMILYGQSYVV